MLAVERTNSFKKDIKRMQKRGKNLEKLKSVILKLVNQEVLPKSLKDHVLIGNYKNTRECHIEPDWLLIYNLTSQLLRLERTGTHADLF